MAAGFVGWRLLRPRAQRASTSISALSAAAAPRSAGQRVSKPNQAQAAQPVPRERERSDAGLLPQGSTRALPYIDRRYGVTVPKEQGLLVVELSAPGSAPQVRIGGRDLGSAPVAIALPAGRHELMLKRGAHTSFRYVVLRAGETRVFQVQE
jgi:hypothetical protein